MFRDTQRRNGRRRGSCVNIVKVMNTRPEMFRSRLRNRAADDIRVADVIAFDADGEDIIVNYQWRVNGVVVLEGPTITTLNGADYFQKGDEVRLDVTRVTRRATRSGRCPVSPWLNTVSVVMAR